MTSTAYATMSHGELLGVVTTVVEENVTLKSIVGEQSGVAKKYAELDAVRRAERDMLRKAVRPLNLQKVCSDVGVASKFAGRARTDCGVVMCSAISLLSDVGVFGLPLLKTVGGRSLSLMAKPMIFIDLCGEEPSSSDDDVEQRAEDVELVTADTIVASSREDEVPAEGDFSILTCFREFQAEFHQNQSIRDAVKLPERDAFILFAYSLLNESKQYAGPVTTLYYDLKDNHTRHGEDSEWMDGADFQELLKGACYRQGFDKLTRGLQERYPWDYSRVSQLVHRLYEKGSVHDAAGALLMFHFLLRIGHCCSIKKSSVAAFGNAGVKCLHIGRFKTEQGKPVPAIFHYKENGGVDQCLSEILKNHPNTSELLISKFSPNMLNREMQALAKEQQLPAEYSYTCQGLRFGGLIERLKRGESFDWVRVLGKAKEEDEEEVDEEEEDDDDEEEVDEEEEDDDDEEEVDEEEEDDDDEEESETIDEEEEEEDDDETLSSWWYSLGEAGGGRVNGGKMYNTMECYAKSLDINPKNSEAWRKLGDAGGGIRVGGSTFNKAQCYKRSLEVDPTSGAVWRSLGSAGGGRVGGQSYTKMQCYVKAKQLDQMAQGLERISKSKR